MTKANWLAIGLMLALVVGTFYYLPQIQDAAHELANKVLYEPMAVQQDIYEGQMADWDQANQ